MDNPTRRLDELPPLPTDARPCLRCGTPMFDALIVAKNTGSFTQQYFQLRVERLLRTSLLWGDEFAETKCSVWVCPDCGYTELVAANPTALLEGR